MYKKDWEKTDDKKKMEMGGRGRLAMQIAEKQNPPKGDEYMSPEAEAVGYALEDDLRRRPGKLKYKKETYKAGGKVRGCGCAKRGVRKAKMR